MRIPQTPSSLQFSSGSGGVENFSGDGPLQLCFFNSAPAVRSPYKYFHLPRQSAYIFSARPLSTVHCHSAWLGTAEPLLSAFRRHATQEILVPLYQSPHQNTVSKQENSNFTLDLRPSPRLSHCIPSASNVRRALPRICVCLQLSILPR